MRGRATAACPKKKGAFLESPRFSLQVPSSLFYWIFYD